MRRKNWIAVASAEHARRGCTKLDNGGFPPGRPKENTAPPRGSALHEVKSVGAGYMQVCHGKCAPLKRVLPGDRVAYYSPALTMGGKDRLQSFVSIGLVQAGEPYAFDMGGGFVPFRRDVAYVPAQEVSILPLLDELEFVENRQRWGYKFRFGLFEVSEHDMLLIARAMRADLAALHLATGACPSPGRRPGRQMTLIQ
ncbi:MAG: EVE domain-containing protein [Polaromonas sp.]